MGSFYQPVETGWYYLNSRYYNPEIGRFINADGQIGQPGDILSHNMYAYCQNNPVMMVDPNGYWPSWATKVVVAVAIIAVIAVVTVATAGTGTVVAAVAAGALEGAIGGAVTGAAFGAVAGYASSGTLEGTLNGMADGMLAGTITGAITGGVAGYAKYAKGATEIIGKPHGSAIHQQRITSQVDDMVKSGKYSKIYMNKELKTAGLVGKQRPDIIGIFKNGNADFYEFASESQAYGKAGYTLLQNKITTMVANNPGIIPHFIPW